MSDTATANRERQSDTRTDSANRHAESSRSLQWGAYLLVVAGVGFVLNGLAMLYRVFYSAGFEAGVHALGGVTHSELASQNHELAHYVDHLHVNVAGLLVAVGIGVAALAWFGVRRGERWSLATAIALPAVFLAHSLPIHQTAGFSFDALVHLGPGALWLPALVVGSVLAYRGLDDGDAGDERRG